MRIQAFYNRAVLRKAQLQGGWSGRIFCVGRNKTGTTTMKRVLTELGYRVAPQEQGEKLIFKFGMHSEKHFWHWVQKYEAFQDLPFSATWFLPELVRRFPKDRYILTVRDPDDWFESLRNHHFQHLGLPLDSDGALIRERIDADTYIAKGYFAEILKAHYGNLPDHLLYDRATFVSAMLRHNEAVHALIPIGNLLEIDLSQHVDTKLICSFLGLPERMASTLPRENQRHGSC